jgi:hypothetical protein
MNEGNKLFLNGTASRHFKGFESWDLENFFRNWGPCRLFGIYETRQEYDY